MAPTVRTRLRRAGRLITFAAGIAACFWFALFLYTMFAALHAPLHLNRATGNVIPWSTHGEIHYITERTANLEDELFPAAMWIIAAEFIGLSLYRGRHMFDRG